MSTKDFVLALARGARGKDAAKALILPQIFGGTGYVNAGTELTVSGTPPLSLPNSLGKPLKAWSVDVVPYQEGTGDPAPDNVRPIHGTDKLTIYTDSKYGGLVEWNQLVKNGNFATKSEWIEYASTYNVEDNIATVTHQSGEYGFIYQPIQCIVGHKYFVSYEVLGNGTFYVYWDARRISDSNTDPQGDWAYGSVIITGANNGVNLSIRTDDSTIGDSWKLRNIQICDLTQMFGTGNEPTTVDEFRALFPNDYYAYNAGQQMTVDQVNGAQYTPAVITLPQTVYTGTIGSEGGGYSWVSADIGALNWTYQSSVQNPYFQCIITAPEVKSKKYSDCLTSTGLTWMQNMTGGTTSDLTISFPTDGYIRIRDNRYTDAESFKTAYAGMQVVYELETPQSFPLTTPTIPTPTGTATTWATAEDGKVDGMEVTYVGKA